MLARRCSLTLLNPMTPTLARSEEHTSELQSQSKLVCRLLLEKKKPEEQRRDKIAEQYRRNELVKFFPKRMLAIRCVMDCPSDEQKNAKHGCIIGYQGLHRPNV